MYYAAGSGPVTIIIKDGKAIVDTSESRTLDYKVDGNKLTIMDPASGDLVLTINDDGTLSGPTGVLSKTSL